MISCLIVREEFQEGSANLTTMLNYLLSYIHDDRNDLTFHAWRSQQRNLIIKSIKFDKIRSDASTSNIFSSVSAGYN